MQPSLKAVPNCGSGIDKDDLYPNVKNSLRVSVEEMYTDFIQSKDEAYKTDGGNKMSSVSREEMQALLAANKAEMESIASSIRAEMALSRENTNVQLASINSAISSISSKIEGKMDSVDGDVKAINGKFEGIQGQITGINTAISGIQSGISIRLAIFGIIIAVVVALPSIISAFKENPVAVQPAAQQPIIIQSPQEPTILPPKDKAR
ncbi:hypothetical protein [Enterobacter cloacae]|uniref:hypothetical protein n=1 Tax=Enterobacter cloacae TaxID=550 RepID=UPI0028740078|nr:hypothetical protein [Enterobacter cloacae]MDS0028102.1 hypothetical protein [Enterobacter cloacae subsp. cloacae]